MPAAFLRMNAGAQQQPVAGELGLGGIFLERGDVERAHAQGDGHRCLFRVVVDVHTEGYQDR